MGSGVSLERRSTSCPFPSIFGANLLAEGWGEGEDGVTLYNVIVRLGKKAHECPITLKVT